jgi:transcriptional regulator with XRE-family HTH domain
MSSTQSLVALIKAELKSQGLSYAELAEALALSESSVKRMLAPGGEMPLSRVDEICRVLKLEFAELAGRLAAQAPALRELSLEQERAVVADPKLLLVAICCLSHWAIEDVLARYRISEPDAVAALAQLDRLGVIELRPHNRYKLKVAKTLRWRPQGPVIISKRSDFCSFEIFHRCAVARRAKVFMNKFIPMPTGFFAGVVRVSSAVPRRVLKWSSTSAVIASRKADAAAAGLISIC